MNGGITDNSSEDKYFRPETPKVNLLQLQQRRAQAMAKVQLPQAGQDKKPFNYLNPYANIAALSQQQALKQTSVIQSEQQAPLLAAKDLYKQKRERSLSKKKQSAATVQPDVEKLLSSQEKEQPQKLPSSRRQPVHERIHSQHSPASSLERGQDCASDEVAEVLKQSPQDLKREQTQTQKQQQEQKSDSDNAMLYNWDNHFFDIMEQEQVGDAIDLNAKFLSMALGGLETSQLSTLTKIELRVDTEGHCLQTTGEILCSLETLKLNDSVIHSFRDIGTSFKNVRFLHIARCEIRELNGIMSAFEQLEELYASFNLIDDLFDISQCEHLNVLDFEGNNVKDVEQLHYLKRLQRLEDVNLRHNPVQSSKMTAVTYYQMVQDSCPDLQVLDDEMVSGEFYQKKIKEAQERELDDSTNLKHDDTNLDEEAVFRKYVSAPLCLDQFELMEACEAAVQLQKLKEEPDDETLLIQTIKNQNKEQKAKQSYDQNLRFFEKQQALLFQSEQDPMMGTFYGAESPMGFNGTIEETDPDRIMRSSNISFFQSTKAGRMTANNFFRGYSPSKFDSDNGSDCASSDLIANTREVLAGSLAILRKKQSASNFGGGAYGSVALSNDIASLINDFHQDADKFQSDVRAQDNNGDEQPVQRRAIRIGSANKRTRGNSGSRAKLSSTNGGSTTQLSNAQSKGSDQDGSDPYKLQQQAQILKTIKLGSTTGTKAMPIKLKPQGGGTAGMIISSGGKQGLTTTTAGENGGKVLLRANKIKFNTEAKSAATQQQQPQQQPPQ